MPVIETGGARTKIIGAAPPMSALVRLQQSAFQADHCVRVDQIPQS